MAKRSADDDLLPAAKRCDPSQLLPTDVWGVISRHCDAKTRRSLALTCTAIARELAKPYHVEEAKKRFTTVASGTGTHGNYEVRDRWEFTPSGHAHGWHTCYRTPHDSTTATFLAKRTHYKDGQRDGLEEKFFEGGKLRKRTNWVRSRKHGMYEMYSGSGQLVYQCPWVHGNRDGAELSWPEGSDRPEYQCEWSEGARHGFEVQYSDIPWQAPSRTHFMYGFVCPGCSECTDDD